MAEMYRARFFCNLDDYRPVIWPEDVKPFWCTGFSDTYSIVVAYVNNEQELKKLWPEAEHIDLDPVNDFVFSDRFPKPDWFSR